MSKGPKESAEWRNGSESLFRAVRADHEGTAADCARVEAEMMRRIAAGASPKIAPDGDEQATAAKLAGAFKPGTLVKQCIGLSLLAAGSLAIMRMVDLAPTPASRPTPSLVPTPPTAAAPASDRALDTAPEAPAPVPEPQDAPAARVRPGREGSIRVAPSRPEPRALLAPKRRSTASKPGDEPVSPAPASVSARTSADSSSDPSSAQPGSSSSTPLDQSDPKTSARPPVQPRAALALTTETKTETSPPAPEGSPQPKTRPVRVDESADARAELALIERIHVAMRAAKPSEALALCAEHAERWPHGTFTEEREAVRAIASCMLRSDDAASRARLFLSQHPRAPTAPRVAAACAPLSAATKP